MKNDSMLAGHPLNTLLTRWEARSRDALPADAMLVNLHVRELRQALATPGATDREHLFVVGKRDSVEDADRGWELQGVFSDQAKAEAACITATCFVGPVQLDVQFPEATVTWQGAYFPAAIASTPAIDTGDTVRHEPTGEDWLVAFVEDGRLCACGWPCSFVPVTDCTLIEKATNEERAGLIRDMAAMSGADPRKAFAQRVLAADGGGAAQ